MFPDSNVFRKLLILKQIFSLDWIHIFECITQNYVLQGACGKYNSETMYNRFGGGVLGVLERQSKGDEWQFQANCPSQCYPLPPTPPHPPTYLSSPNYLITTGRSMGRGRETIRHKHCNTSNCSFFVDPKFGPKLPKQRKIFGLMH